MKRFAAFLLAFLAASPLYAGTRELKEDTATVVVVGPFVDTAGAAVTAPTIASIDITAYKNDGTAVTITPAASGTSNDMVHVDDGYYSLELTTTDTNTAGYLRLTFQISGALIFHEDFQVRPANIYDSNVVGTGVAWANVTQWSFQSVATVDTNGYPKVTIKSGTGAGEVSLASGAVPIQSGTGTGQLDVTSGVVKADARQWLGTAIATPDTAGYPKVTIKSGTGTGELSLASGVVDADMQQILGTAVTDTGAGADFGDNLAGNFSILFGSTRNDGVSSAGVADIGSIKTRTDRIPNVAAGSANGLLIAGSNAATTFATLTSTGAFTINGVSNVAQTGDSFARIGAPVGASISADVAATTAAIAALNNLSAAQVNAEVLDVLNTDTFAEPTGTPGATVSLQQKIGFLYMALRNPITVTATKKTFLDDSGAGEWSKPLSDDGTTYTEGEATTP